MTTEEKKALARRLHGEGYNCAQCVLRAHAAEVGLGEREAVLAGAGFGAGAGCGELCGVVSGLAVLAGHAVGDASAKGKLRAMPTVRGLAEKFSAPYGGKLTCRELKGKCGVGCDILIDRGVELFEDYLRERES